MTTTIHPGNLKGIVQAPPSKSIAQRALAIAAIRPGTTILQHIGTAADVQAALSVIEAMGCTVLHAGATATITPAGQHDIHEVHFGESGLAARMFTPLLSLNNTTITLNGQGSLLLRPMTFLRDILPQLGVSVSSTDEHLPMTLQGPLHPKSITVDGSLSSQFITGLILAYTAAGANDVSITVQNPVSTPYLALTLQVMQELQLPVPGHSPDFTQFDFRGGALPATTIDHTIEGDWSAAAFLLVAGAIAGDLEITGLNMFTEQADKAILEALMDAGAELSITMDELVIRKSVMKAFHFDATHCPDLFPPLAVLAAFCSGTSVIEGIHRLVHKESNRAITLQEELGKLGIRITLQDDLMLIEGRHPVNGGQVHARGDHRIAMACAVATLRADGPVMIDDAAAVQKSWPAFFEDLQSLGVNITTA